MRTALRQFAIAGVILAAMAVLGTGVGLAWWVFAPRARVTVADDGTTVPYPVTETLFATEGYFALMTLVVGLVTGYGAYLAQQRLARRTGTDPRPVTLVSVAVGAVVGSLIAWRLGVMLDSAEFHRALAAARPGDRIEASLRLHARSALLLWPFVAVLQFALVDAVCIWRGRCPYPYRDHRVSAPGSGEVTGRRSER